MADKRQDDALREMAANRGCRLVKSRRRKPGGDYGRYGLTDRKTGRKIFGFAADGLTASAPEIEDFLRGSAASTWKSSLAASGKAGKAAKGRKAPPAPAQPIPATRRRSPRPQAKSRPAGSKSEASAEPPAEPPRLRIRTADSVDSEAIAILLAELGYRVSADDVAERLQRLARAGEPVLIARQGDETLGCLSWHVTPNIHRPWPIGRIVMMVVAKSARRRGIGRALVEAAEERMVQRGCGLVEVTSNVKLRAAHAFYERLGFERTSHRFARSIGA